MAAGAWTVSVSQACATTALVIAEHDTWACAEASVTPAVTPLSIRVDLAELQISLWDDDRRRFTQKLVRLLEKLFLYSERSEKFQSSLELFILQDSVTHSRSLRVALVSATGRHTCRVI